MIAAYSYYYYSKNIVMIVARNVNRRDPAQTLTAEGWRMLSIIMASLAVVLSYRVFKTNSHDKLTAILAISCFSLGIGCLIIAVSLIH